MRTLGLSIFLALAACGGSTEPSPTPSPPSPSTSPPSSPSPASGFVFDQATMCRGDRDAVTATAIATTETTACLQHVCDPVSQCGEVTKSNPVCVVEGNGGILVGMYACPPGCCY